MARRSLIHKYNTLLTFGSYTNSHCQLFSPSILSLFSTAPIVSHTHLPQSGPTPISSDSQLPTVDHRRRNIPLRYGTLLCNLIDWMTLQTGDGCYFNNDKNRCSDSTVCSEQHSDSFDLPAPQPTIPDPQGFQKLQPISPTPEMVTKLATWLLYVHENHYSHPQPLLLALSLLRIYTQKRQVLKDKFQCLGIACLYISYKYLLGLKTPLPIQEAAQTCANKYSISQLVFFEAEILEAVEFNLEIDNIYTHYLNLRRHLEEVGDKWSPQEAKIMLWSQAWLLDGSQWNWGPQEVLSQIVEYVSGGAGGDKIEKMLQFLKRSESGYLRYSYMGILEGYINELLGE